MTAPGNQRWREGRDSYRRPDEPIRTLDHEVAELEDDATAKAFVVRHHYSGSYPAARWRFGLFEHGQFVGVAVFSHPSNDKVITNVFPGAATDGTELGRFVLLDRVAGNGETWFLARAFELLRRTGLRGVVSFSDPLPRAAADGRVVMPGHVGTIYQAFNAHYLERSTPRTLTLLPDGTVFSARTMQKIRARERGWAHAVEQLVAFGAPAPCPEGDPRAWLRRALVAVGARRVRHPGNHRYAWALDRRARGVLPPRDPARYPKRGPA